MLLRIKTDGEYKTIEVNQHEFERLVATGKFIKLGNEYYHLDHITKFAKVEKDSSIDTNPVPKHILFKKG